MSKAVRQGSRSKPQQRSQTAGPIGKVSVGEHNAPDRSSRRSLDMGCSRKPGPQQQQLLEDTATPAVSASYNWITGGKLVARLTGHVDLADGQTGHKTMKASRSGVFRRF